ncbi:MAG: hypothetical protein ACO38P_13495, partial [Phycisphaerales bacterium]
AAGRRAASSPVAARAGRGDANAAGPRPRHRGWMVAAAVPACLALAAAFVVLGRPIVVEVRDAVLPPDVRERLVESARFTASIGAGSMAIEVGMEPTASTDGLPSGGIPMGLAHGMMERMP